MYYVSYYFYFFIYSAFMKNMEAAKKDGAYASCSLTDIKENRQGKTLETRYQW